MQYSYKKVQKQAKFSQNYLASGDLVDILVKKSKIYKNDFVIEVGGAKA